MGSKKVVEVSKLTRWQFANRLSNLREQIGTLYDDAVVEDNDTQAAHDTLATVFDLISEAEGYLNADDADDGE